MSREQMSWQEKVLNDIREAGFRLARPVRASDGRRFFLSLISSRTQCNIS
jgi:Ser/Thr protein kinase RdoA (MazF antagonist)